MSRVRRLRRSGERFEGDTRILRVIHGREARATWLSQMKSPKLLRISATLLDVGGILSPTCAKFKQNF